MENQDDRIELLSGSLVDRIAAGEVVERPASVVKELVENALDAGATHISITVDDGGFSLIRVADNGRGMSPENLGRAVQRHATSKIRTFDDLFLLSTMGFRGEALASIGSVSRLEITSACTGSGLGMRIRVEGSERKDPEPASCGKGTIVEVRDLFYNTPARRKFMKTGKAERMAVVRLFEELAVPFCSVHFILTMDNQKIADAPPVADILQRVGQIGGADFAQTLVECRGSFDGIDAHILISKPENARPRPRFQSLYVNLRRIDSDAVTFSIRNAFREYVQADVKPAFFCLLSIDPGRVDVNIHPTKQKLKFDDEKRIAGGIYHAVGAGINARLNPMSHEPAPFASSGSGHLSAAEPKEGYPALPFQPDRAESGTGRQAGEEQIGLVFSGQSMFEQKSLEAGRDPGVSLAGAVTSESWDLISCVQIHDLFILAPIKNGILLIDQHAAHERILYEHALDMLKKGSSASQQLLFPFVMELSIAERAVLKANLDHFSRFGYELFELSGNAISVSAVPASVDGARAKDAIREMLDYLLDERSGRTFPSIVHRMAAAFACGNAIKQGQRLTTEEMNGLLNSLFAAQNPYTCPHGRPTIIRISVEELKRRFLR
jgi:DNA mismatch repair protein MutL